MQELPSYQDGMQYFFYSSPTGGWKSIVTLLTLDAAALTLIWYYVSCIYSIYKIIKIFLAQDGADGHFWCLSYSQWFEQRWSLRKICPLLTWVSLSLLWVWIGIAVGICLVVEAVAVELMQQGPALVMSWCRSALTISARAFRITNTDIGQKKTWWRETDYFAILKMNKSISTWGSMDQRQSTERFTQRNFMVPQYFYPQPAAPQAEIN